MANDKGYILDIEDVLKPRGFNAKVRTMASRTEEKDKDIGSVIREMICTTPAPYYGPNDLTKDRSCIKSVINDLTTESKENSASSDEENFSYRFSAISSKHGVICTNPKYDDRVYWKQSLPEDQKASEVNLKTYFINTFDEAQCDVAVMVSRDPYISPSEAGTEDIEMFLNYTPPHVANRLTPYLEVQFVSNRSFKTSGENPSSPESFNYLNTPGIMRFLLGSIDANTLNVYDGPMLQVEFLEDPISLGGESRGIQRTRRSIAGMESFLAPQALTNMDGLKAGDHTQRLMDVKPFLPLASITSFEVTVMNAGAGDMTNMRGKLELKIHDKARLSEFSEFLNGGVGFATGRIWTSFGWLGPLGVNANEDKYAEFINSKMHLEQCWMVYNSSFSFDQSGQVTLTLQLSTHGVSQAKRTSIKSRSGNYEAYLNSFQRLLEEIAMEAKELGARTGLGADARLMQVLNTAAKGDMLGGVEPQNVKKAITEVIDGYTSSGVIDKDKGASLIEKLQRALDPNYTGDNVDAETRNHPGRQGVEKARLGSIVEILRDSINGPDPFLPYVDLSKGENQDTNKYFNSRYMEELYYGIDGKYRPNVVTGSNDPNAQQQPAAVAEQPKKVTRIKIDVPKAAQKFVSFGKLYIANVIPAFLEANLDIKSDPNAEIQVIFYRLNDECGPVSGQSIAEFACDLERFAYAVDDQLKSLNKHDLTIDEFTKLLVKTQFKDGRAVGFGKLSRGLYKPFDSNSTEGADWKEIPSFESQLVAWQAENPIFSPPMIETYVEVVKTQTNSAYQSSQIHELIENKKNGSLKRGTLVRFHIYDRQADSKMLFRKFVEVAGRPEIGTLDDSLFRQRIKQNIYTAKSIETFLKDLESIRSENTENSREKELALAEQVGIRFKTPTGVNEPLSVERKLFGPRGIRASLSMLAPTLQIGSNGTLISSVNLSSKANDLAAAGFLVRQMQGKSANNGNSTDPPPSGLEDSGGLPITTFPATLNITCMGVPIARPYQEYFIDLGTGTTLDNLYKCTSITHQIQPGKFTTSMEFMYSDGYGKFRMPPALQKVLQTGQRAIIKAQADQNKKKEEEAKNNASKATGGGGGKGGAIPASGVYFKNGVKQASYTPPKDAKAGEKIKTPPDLLDALRKEGIVIGENATPESISAAVAEYNKRQKDKSAKEQERDPKAKPGNVGSNSTPAGQTGAPGDKKNDPKSAAQAEKREYTKGAGKGG